MATIFVHGLGQSSSSWEDTVSYLEGYKSINCPDLSLFLGKGEATYKKLYQSFEDDLKDIKEPLNLCGLSLGAVIALNYVIDHPEKVKSLILIAPQYEMPKTLLKLQNIIFHLMPESVFVSTKIRKKDFIQLTRSMIDLNFTDSLKDISCPVLVICGEKDTANKKAAKKLVTYIKKAQLQFISNAKHEVNREAPKELAKVIVDFYNKTI